MEKSIHKIGVLLIDGFALMSYASVVEPLRTANLLAGRKLYDVRHLPQIGGQAVSSSGAVMKATAHVGEQVDFDLVLVVAGDGVETYRDLRVFDWLRNLDRRGVRLGGVSGGPVVLAAAGLMAGRRMTVHWEHAPALSEIVPGFDLASDLYVIDDKRITCAGGTAPLDMMHALIAEQHGGTFARQVSDRLLYTDIRQPSGPQRSGLVERYGTNSPALIRAIEAMETNIAAPLTLKRLADYAGLGERQLNRLFRDKLAISAMHFYRNMRLDQAKNLLAHSSLPVTEIAFATGFGGSAHFSQAFKAKYGFAPSNIRKGV